MENTENLIQYKEDPFYAKLKPKIKLTEIKTINSIADIYDKYMKDEYLRKYLKYKSKYLNNK
jgi:hypothetical protein